MNNMAKMSVPIKKAKIPTRKQSLWSDSLRRLMKNKAAAVSLVLILVVILACCFAEIISPYDYAKQDYSCRFSLPSLEHPMGTDNFGRDIFSRVLKGGQISLLISLCSVALSIIVGVILGATAAYFGSYYGGFIMRLMDILMGIPPLLLAVSISAALGSGTINTIIAVSASTLPTFVRTMYAAVLTEIDKEYVEAAHICGARSLRKILRHILPNALAPIIVAASLRIGNSIMTISSLSFIGLGVQPPTPEWGSIMSAGRQYIRDFWPLVTFPGIMIAIVVIGFNIFGDALRDALDPRLKK